MLFAYILISLMDRIHHPLPLRLYALEKEAVHDVMHQSPRGAFLDEQSMIEETLLLLFKPKGVAQSTAIP